MNLIFLVETLTSEMRFHHLTGTEMFFQKQVEPFDVSSILCYLYQSINDVLVMQHKLNFNANIRTGFNASSS